jgi:uncharacterized protein
MITGAVMTATLMPPTLPIALATLATLLLATPASAAGFNCAYAKLATEVLICQDDTLSSVDEANARVYSAVANALPGFRKHAYHENGRQWLKARNGCGYDAECVAHQYVLNFEYMCNIASDRLILPDCKGVSTANNQAQPPATESYDIVGTIGVDPWVTDPYLALRTHPSTVYGKRIAELKNGTNVEILDTTRTDGWWFVRTSNGQTGWAKAGAGYDGQDRTWIHTDEDE